MILKRAVLFGCVGVFLLAGSLAHAQDYAPTPRRSPRTPVAKQVLVDNKKAPMPPSRTVSGSATIVDTERLRINDVDMRLFGVVPPQLSASFGPQARAVLDGLNAGGPVTCHIRDRAPDGRFLATCRDARGADFSLELLRRGLAATARGSLRPTELAAPYEAAEQAAQAQRLGLWSVSLPTAVSDTTIMTGMANAAAQAAAKEALAKTDAKEETPPPVAAKPAAPEATPKAEQPDSNAPPPFPVLTAEDIQTALSAGGTTNDSDERGFLFRYQLLITGLLMLLTAAGVVAALAVQRWKERHDELRSIAAALRGELMAARAVCQARLNTMTADADEKNISWPRIRALVFQAYVGRLGRLGAELSRQIASIYGQASDYAAYYSAAQSAEAKFEPVSKRQALQTLVRHIEVVLPRLAGIERGEIRIAGPSGARRPRYQAPVPPMPSYSYEEATERTDEETAEKTETAAETVSTPAPETATASEASETAAVTTEETATPAATEEPASPTTTPLWGKIKKMATERLDRAQGTSPEDVPDYTAMTEEEMEALAYIDKVEETESAPAAKPKGKKRRAF